MSKNKVEEAAVLEVKKLINNSNVISGDNIKTNDKGQSFDGHMILYVGNPDKKKNFLNNIDVQVKGRTVKELPSAKKIKFQMDIADLENYKKVGGTIIFYVSITGDRSRARIYIKSLLPYEINEIFKNGLNEKGDKASLNFDFIDINEKEKFEAICYQFQDDKDKQYSYKNENITFDDIKEKKGKLEMNFRFPKEINFSDIDIINNNKFLYFIPEDIKISIPIGLTEISAIEINSETQINVGGEIYKRNVILKKSGDNTFIKIGKSIIYNENESSFTFSLKGKMSSIEEEITFINAFRNKRTMTFEKNNFELPIESDFHIIDEQIKKMEQLKIILKEFDVDDDLNIDFSDKKSNINLNILIDSIINNKTFFFKSDMKIFVSTMKIFNINLAFIAERVENDKYKIKNFCDFIYSEKYQASSLDCNNKRVVLYPNYIALQNNFGFDMDVLLCSNIFDKMAEITIDEDKLFSYEKNEELLNSLFLEFLKVYDSTKKEKIYKFLKKIIFVLLKKDDEIYKINNYQLIARKNSLTEEDLEQISLIRERSNNVAIKASASILLRSEVEYNIFFKKMSEDERQQFLNFPIVNLLNKINKVGEIN